MLYIRKLNNYYSLYRIKSLFFSNVKNLKLLKNFISLTKDNILAGDLFMDARLHGVVGEAQERPQPHQHSKSAKHVLHKPHPGWRF